MLLVNLGAAYPNQLLTVVLRGEAKRNVNNVNGKTMREGGKRIDYKGKPEIIVSSSSSFQIKD